jgi:hypothetical protein
MPMMSVRVVVAGAALLCSLPVSAQERLSAEQARSFVAGKLFAYTCFDGTAGAGRIQADGSAVGTIQFQGKGPVHRAALPVNTLQLKGDSVCASIRGMPFQPCFNVYKLDNRSFRGAISGLGFAYCDFTRRSPRVQVAGGGVRERAARASVASSVRAD